MMNPIYRTIFLDNSIIEANNFVEENSKLKFLGEYAKDGFIQIYITSINYNESLSSIKKNLESAYQQLSNIKRSLKEAKILRVCDNYKELYDKVSVKYNPEKEYEGIIEKFDSFIKEHKIKIIDISGIDIKKIFKDYFLGISPFNKGNKKSEFPDAFSIASIENWCANKSKKVTYLTTDKDFDNYESKNVFIEKNLSKILDLLVREKLIKDTEETIDSIITIEQDNIIAELESSAQDFISEYIFYLFEKDINKVFAYCETKIESIRITDHSIINFSKYDARVEINGTISFHISFEYKDYSKGYYYIPMEEWQEPELIDDENYFSLNFSANSMIDHSPQAGKELAGFSHIENFRLLDDFEI